MSEKRCHVCNRIIQTRHNTKYCSRKCYKIDKAQKPKPCPVCGKMFTNIEPGKVYCSYKCFRAGISGRALYEYKCPTCGKPFQSRKKERKYCSKKCYWKDHRIKNTKTCEYCGNTFVAKNQEIQYCSRQCLYKAKARTEKQCPVCGKTFVCDKPSQQYCSHSCFIMTRRSDRIRGSRNFSAKQRFKIMERDGHECVLCQSTKSLEVDHVLAFALGGNATMENGQTLCHKCHVEKTIQDMELLKLQRLKLPLH